jgi:hypothetical protein
VAPSGFPFEGEANYRIFWRNVKGFSRKFFTFFVFSRKNRKTPPSGQVVNLLSTIGARRAPDTTLRHATLAKSDN